MKKIFLLLVAVFIFITVWFLFIKPADFKAAFKAKTTVGAVNQTLKIWNSSLSDSQPIEQNTLSELVQKRRFGDSTYIYTYQLKPVNDSLTEVLIGVKDSANSLTNRVQGLFEDTPFEKKVTETVKEFYEVIKEHEKNHKVTIEGVTTLPAKEYAYTELKAVQTTKALGMMRDISLLQTAMARYDVPLDGTPFVQVTQWNQENDSIHYNFCFPIKAQEADSLPQWENIKYGNRKEQKAIKAIYNGNYITSDRAWYALLNYAKRNNIEVLETPYEEFFNNPNMGGDAMQWKAEIYLPLKE